MLSSLALRSFIFHPNQRLVLKAERKAPARPAYAQRPRCTPEFFVTLPGGGKTFPRPFVALFSRLIEMREIRRLGALPDHARLHQGEE